MATFEIQGPDGKTYQVEAPDMQSAAAALGSFAQPAGGSSVDQGNLGAFRQGGSDLEKTANDFVTGFANGGTFGFGDNIAAGIGGVDSMLRGQGFRRGHDATLEIVRDGMDEARRESPAATTIGEIGGGAIPAAAGGLAVSGGKGALQQIGRLMAVGAGEGALMGAGNSDGGDLAADTLQGAALGAGLGAAAKPVASGLQAIGRAASAPVAGAVDAVLGRASQGRANNVMARAISRSGRTIDDLQQEALAASRAGQPEYTVADMLGSPGQGALSGVARTPGEGSKDIFEFLQLRQANAGDRMGNFLAEGFDASETAAQRSARLATERSATAGANYSAAREGARPVDVRGALGVIDSRLGQTADAAGTGFTGDGVDSVFSRYRNRLAADRVPSDIDAMELSDFDRVLGVKQDLQDDIGAALRAGRNNEARELGGVMRELDAALEASSDGYRTANDTFRQQSQAIDAVDAGAAAASPRRRAEDNIQAFNAMAPDQQDSFRTGMGDQLIGKVEAQTTGANRAAPLLRNKTQAEIAAIANNPDDLLARIQRENTMSETRQRAIGGSMTANNLEDMDDVQPFDVGLLGNLLSGNYTTAATQAGQKGVNAALGRNEATQQLIARMLLSNDPQAALAPMLRQQSRSGVNNAVIQGLLRQSGQKALN